MRTIGLDLGKIITFCEISEGKITQRGVMHSIDELASVLGNSKGKAKVAFEACREAWHVADVVRQLGHEPLLVDTTRVRQLGIGQHRRKNDRIDAECLARATAENRLPKAHELSKPRQELRLLVNQRALLLSMRTTLINHIRGMSRVFGSRLPSCNADEFLKNLKRWTMPENVRQRLESLIKPLEEIEKSVADADQQLQECATQERATQLLETTPGVGPIVAASFISVIDSPDRFSSAHQVESYVGIVPGENSTGGKRRLGGISKHGNSYLRSVLVQAGWCILRSKQKSTLKSWGQKVASRRGKKVAAVAIARRLVGILWAMWRDGKPFEANHQPAFQAVTVQAITQQQRNGFGMSAEMSMSQ